MNADQSGRDSRNPRRFFSASLLLGALGLLSACASTSTGNNNIQGFDQLNLSPGDTGKCLSSPCQVNLQIPAGSGSFEVTGNWVNLGTYPAGQNANLGGFYSSQVLEIKGMNVPKAYAYIRYHP